MSLDDLVRKTKAVLNIAKEDLWDRPDEWIRKQYEKVGERIPESHLYNITSAFSFSGIIGTFLCSKQFLNVNTFQYDINMSFFAAVSLGLLLSHFIHQDLVYNYYGLRGQILSSSNPLPDPLITYYTAKNRIARFPIILLAGSNLTQLDMYGVSISFLFFASSMYLKDMTPRQFKKEPFWKQAYDAVAEKVRSYLPKPTPVPVPIPAQHYAVADSVASL